MYLIKNDARNAIHDLQRDLHANDFALCEENAVGTRTLLFANTETICACVFEVRIRFRVTHGIAGSTQIFQLRQGEYREFSSWDVQLVSCFFPVSYF